MHVREREDKLTQLSISAKYIWHLIPKPSPLLLSMMTRYTVKVSGFLFIERAPGLPCATRVERTASECKYPVRVTARYSLVPPQTVCFWFDQKLKNHGLASTRRVFEPLEPSLQHPRLRSTTNFVYHQKAIVQFFHARSHTLSPGCRPRSGVNCMRPPELLNNAKSRTATTSLRGSFHPGIHLDCKAHYGSLAHIFHCQY